MLTIGLKILKTIIRMNKIEQLTFPWSKPNNSSFNDFYFEKNKISHLTKIMDRSDPSGYQSSLFCIAPIQRQLNCFEFKSITRKIVKHEIIRFGF